MTIQQIKSKLSILTVLSHYGLEMDRNGMLCCPFHEDGKASMKVYEDTNTVYCFAGSCKVSNLDTIDFIMQMDGSSKHEAIKKAKQMASEIVEAPKVKKTEVKQADPVQDFNRYLKAFAGHKKAQEYCEGRSLAWKTLEVGYKSRKAPDRWSRGCIIFPLENEAGQVVSLYGRSIYGQGHYYQSGRSGLYPAHPPQNTKVLLLTESIIDAATLLPLELDCTILALYGTNGLSEEHQLVIKHLVQLKEIILAMDGDEAGRQAGEQIARAIKKIRSRVKISRLEIDEGEDVNSLAVAHDDKAGLFKQLIDERKEIVIEQKKEKPVVFSKLDTTNPNNLSYKTPVATYRIKGGLRISERDLDSLKVTLVVEYEGRKSRQKLDLYEDKQVMRVSRAVAEKLELRADLVEVDLSQLTDELEAYREQLLKEEPNQESNFNMSTGQRSACMTFLKSKNLLAGINQKIGQAGLAGEERNRLLLFIVASSYAMPRTLHALIQGASGSGKTRLLEVISELMPEEKVRRYTRVTDGSFYNQGEYFFTNKLLCFEDIDGLKEEALLAVRELQSNEILITSTSFKDENGSIRGGERVVRGPIASISCTTRAEVYEDNISRCFVVAVDESREQTLKVIQYQNEKSAGLIDSRKEKEVKTFLQNCMRLLQGLEVINPYANRIHLPKEAHKIRRLNELYQSFVRQITLLHQYQRKRDERGRVISTIEDLRSACDILFESIVLKVDELDGSLRQFYEELKAYVGTRGQAYEFTQREIRHHFRISKTQMQRYIHSLLELEYIRQRGFANRGYRYEISYWDDNQALRQKLTQELHEQLKSVKTI
jgi:DNA primase